MPSLEVAADFFACGARLPNLVGQESAPAEVCAQFIRNLPARRRREGCGYQNFLTIYLPLILLSNQASRIPILHSYDYVLKSFQYINKSGRYWIRTSDLLHVKQAL